MQEVVHEFWRDDFRASFEQASARFQLAAAVAEYAEILRESYWAQDNSLESVLSLVQRTGAALADDPDVAEFVWLVSRASQLGGG